MATSRTPTSEREQVEVVRINLNSKDKDKGKEENGSEDERASFLGNETKDKKGQVATSSFEVSANKNAVYAVIFYWVVSLSLVFLNKAVMVGDITNLDAPLFMSWTQFAMTVFWCWVLGILGRRVKVLSLFPPFEFDLSVAFKVLPLTIVFLGMIVFNNLCLKYVEVSFYQVARSLTIVFNVIFTKILLSKNTHYKTLLCCAIIIFGYWLGCEGELHWSWQGIIFGVLSSIFVALNSIYVKRILPVVDDNSEKLMIYNNLNACIILPVFIFLFTDEASELQLNHEAMLDAVFWIIVVITGVFGFLINFASYLQIKFTSPLSHNVSGTAKAAAQTAIALMIFRNPVTVQGIVGIIVVILGSFAYSRVR